MRATGSDDGVDGVTIPVDPAYTPHLYATQSDIFNQCTETSVISHAGGGGPGVDGILTPPYGLSMPQVAGVLRCHLNTTTSSCQNHSKLSREFVYTVLTSSSSQSASCWPCCFVLIDFNFLHLNTLWFSIYQFKIANSFSFCKRHFPTGHFKGQHGHTIQDKDNRGHSRPVY